MVNAESETGGKERITDRRPKNSPRAVLAAEFLGQDVPLRAAWVGTLKDKRDISSAIRHLTRILPGMSHLKRCSGKRLVLAFAAPISVDNSSPSLPTVGNTSHPLPKELEEVLGSSGDDFGPGNFEGDFEMVRVPASAPRTKAQARAATKIWPLNFHPDPYVERTLSGACFTHEDLRTIDRCMGMCIVAARREARGNDDCTGSAIVFDPRRDKIVAIAASRIDVNPMWHAAILAVDLVARLQGGGAYDLVLESVDCRKRKYTGSRPETRLPVAFPARLSNLAESEEDSTSGCEIVETGSRAEVQLPVGFLELARHEGDSTSGSALEETRSRDNIQLPELARSEKSSTSGCGIEETGSRDDTRLPVTFSTGLPEQRNRKESSTSGCGIEETGSRDDTRLPVTFSTGLPEQRNREESSTSGCRIDETGSRDASQLPVATPTEIPEPARPEESSTSGRGVEDEEERKRRGSDYLCTSYWAFLLREPCPLCAMALVHSRVSDIFWGAENESRGVLGSKALLHAVPGLNHRYRVWRGVREEECRRVCQEIIGHR